MSGITTIALTPSGAWRISPPRLNEVVKKARAQGATIIHAPSDCMAYYAKHPARARAMAVPKSKNLPGDIQSWCSWMPLEAGADYPIDQSDGGEDDDPVQHQEWAAKLKALGRNPNLPWKAQSPLIEIEDKTDFISDKGDEIWSILQQRNITKVILTGVHANMCVLGRPFGLRQLVKNGKTAVLMRDMTDSMYNPARWPYTDHLTGNDLVISYIERKICPTITSDQLLGGKPHQLTSDRRTARDVMEIPPPGKDKIGHWTLTRISEESPLHLQKPAGGPVWLRCSVRVPAEWIPKEGIQVKIPSATAARVWINGTEIESKSAELWVKEGVLIANDTNLLVIRLGADFVSLTGPPALHGKSPFTLKGTWQMRVGDEPSWANMPLPAKFGAPPNIFFSTRK